MTNLTEADVVRMLAETDEDHEFGEDELREMFEAVYGREPDDEDCQVGLYSLICAGVVFPEEAQ